MTIGLHDAEKEHMKRKTFPNLALMKLSARIPISWFLWTITSSQAVTGFGNWNA